MVTNREKELLVHAVASGIHSQKELANFMAQVTHESTGLKRLEEGFRYTKGSHQVSDKVSSALREGPRALEAARLEALGGKPEKLAELMYGGRMGNDEPGDGFKYRGRGYIQLTGKSGYMEAGKALGLDLVNSPDLAAEPDNASKIAVWYWNKRVHQVAPESVTGATRIINGGYNGLEDRKSRFAEWEKKLTPEVMMQLGRGEAQTSANLLRAGSKTTAMREIQTHASAQGGVTAQVPSLRQGGRGTTVAELQRQLDAMGYTDEHNRPLEADGRFGLATRYALQTFQREHGLTPDGIAGPKTIDTIRNLVHVKPPPSELLPLINEAGHPGFDMFRQAQAGVHRLDAQHGRVPDLHSDQLSACLVVTAWRAGMDRIDHVALGTDASHIFAAQGALNSPFKQVAGVETMEAFNTPVAQSTQDWRIVTQERIEQDLQRIPQPELHSQDQARAVQAPSR